MRDSQEIDFVPIYSVSSSNASLLILIHPDTWLKSQVLAEYPLEKLKRKKDNSCFEETMNSFFFTFIILSFGVLQNFLIFIISKLLQIWYKFFETYCLQDSFCIVLITEIFRNIHHRKYPISQGNRLT